MKYEFGTNGDQLSLPDASVKTPVEDKKWFNVATGDEEGFLIDAFSVDGVEIARRRDSWIDNGNVTFSEISIKGIEGWARMPAVSPDREDWAHVCGATLSRNVED